MAVFKYIAYAILIWNMVVYFLYVTDKMKSKGEGRRTSEKTLLACTFALGGIGGVLGVYLLRHKSKRDKFRILTPLAFVLTLLVLFLLMKGIM